MTTATYLRPDTTKFPVATLYRDDGYTPVPVLVRLHSSRRVDQRLGARHGQLRTLPPRPRDDRRQEAACRRRRSSAWSARRRRSVRARDSPSATACNMYRIADTTGWMWTQHNGGVEGGLSDLSYVPDQGIGYAFQINTGNGNALSQIQGLVRAFLTQGLTPAAPVARTPVAARSRAEVHGLVSQRVAAPAASVFPRAVGRSGARDLHRFGRSHQAAPGRGVHARPRRRAALPARERAGRDAGLHLRSGGWPARGNGDLQQRDEEGVGLRRGRERPARGLLARRCPARPLRARLRWRALCRPARDGAADTARRRRNGLADGAAVGRA